MEELQEERVKTEAHIQSLKKRKADLSVSTTLFTVHTADHQQQCVTKFDPHVLPEEEHRRNEAADSRALWEHAVCPEAGRAGHPGLPGAGPEKDKDQTGPGFKGLDPTPGAGH